MLQRLFIANYALISKAEITFDAGFSVVTGETGSGKSIMMDALSLVLGERAEAGILKNKAEKCLVEAEFIDVSPTHRPFFEQQELDYDSTIILRREINPQGKSRSFVNDTPVTLAVLSQIGALLADIHAQHEHLRVADEVFRFQILDAVAGTRFQLADYLAKLSDLKSGEIEMAYYRESLATLKAEEAYNRFQFEELDSAGLDTLQETELSEKLNQAENAEEILKNLSLAIDVLTDDERGVVSALKSAAAVLEKAGRHNSRCNSVAERLRQSAIELADAADELGIIQNGTAMDPAEKLRNAETLDRLNTLLVKHRLPGVPELLVFRDALASRLTMVDEGEGKITELEDRVMRLREACSESAAELTRARYTSAPALAESTTLLLQQLGMAHAELQLVITPRIGFGPMGADHIEFLFSANAGSPLRPADKIASGGEISRLMLCLKSISARHLEIPTLILDEADAGTGGEVAMRIADLLRKTGQHAQVIAITHLPQIAAAAKGHFKVSKLTSDNKTEVSIHHLKQPEREAELAEMLSGKNFSEAALFNARELLKG